MPDHGGLCYCVECLGTDLDRPRWSPANLSLGDLAYVRVKDENGGVAYIQKRYLTATDDKSDDCHIVEPK